jgi:hypothetical protein
MKKNLPVLFIVTTLSIFSCNKEDNVPTNFEVEVAAGYLPSGMDGWIIFHGSDGKVLDSKQLANGQTYKFSKLKTPEGKVGVTLVNVYNTSAKLESYLMVPTPTKWTLTPVQQTGWSCGDQLGLQDAGLSPNPNDVSLSDSHQSLFPPSIITVNSSVDFPSYTMRKDCDHDFFLYIMDKNGEPHYKFLENILPGKYTYSLTDFQQFDHTLNFDFPECTMAFLTVTGLEDGQEAKRFTINNLQTLGNTLRSSMKAGYLDRFQKYVTTFGAGYYSHGLFYTEVGAIPTSINLPVSFEAVITNDKFDTYSFTANENFVSRNSLYLYYPSVNTELSIEWRVYASKENTFKNLDALPQPFLDKYPGFHKENVYHQSTEFYTQYETLDVVEAQRFQNSATPEAYKHASKIVYY